MKVFFALFSLTVAVIGQDKPNLIVIMTDDMGYADVGFNGCKDIDRKSVV